MSFGGPQSDQLVQAQGSTIVQNKCMPAFTSTYLVGFCSYLASIGQLIESIYVISGIIDWSAGCADTKHIAGTLTLTAAADGSAYLITIQTLLTIDVVLNIMQGFEIVEEFLIDQICTGFIEFHHWHVVASNKSFFGFSTGCCDVHIGTASQTRCHMVTQMGVNTGYPVTTLWVTSDKNTDDLHSNVRWHHPHAIGV